VDKAIRVCLFGWIVACCSASAEPGAAGPADSSAGIEIDQVQITGRIDGPDLAVTVEFEARTRQADRRMVLLQGQAVLEQLDPRSDGGLLEYDPNAQAYRIAWPQPGRHRVVASFAVQGRADPNGPWRQAALRVPDGRVRQIRLVAHQPELEVQLPGALRVQRREDQGQLEVEALLGPREPLQIRWKPQVQLADAKLVLSSQASTIVDVRTGVLHVDAVLDFQVAQGRIEVLTVGVPEDLRVTALQGASVRTWVVGEAADGVRLLRVELSRPQEREYRLRIQAEAPLDRLPCVVEIPVLEPTGGIRAGGHLAVGTDSALQVVVEDASGLTQIDGAAFPRVQAPDGQDRPIPQGKAFFYTHAGGRYGLRIRVDDIVSTYEVSGRVVAKVREDDLVVDADLELDVRDSPLRQLEVLVPAGLVVAAVDGNQVDDYRLSDAGAQGQPTRVQVVFKDPVLGRTLVHLRMELGRGPLGERQSLASLGVVGAKTQRGYVVVATEAGIEIDPPQADGLREVHTASVPMRVAQAQYAYRFREADWTLGLMARRRAAEVRAEVFHLQSIGEALAHGSAVVNYLITGSPVDELRFLLPAEFENVEFVGRDVRRWVRQDDTWVVKLNRKVLGDYNLAVTYTQRYGPERPIQLGALHCRDVQIQTGYVVVTSHLDLRLEVQGDPAAAQGGLLPIALDELPGDYRLLTSSPILAAYRYVTEPHTARLSIDPFARSGLLPVVVDIADLQTRLAIRPDGPIESVTTVRYKVKNTSGQFLALTLPPDARVWAVSLIEAGPDGREQATRLAASADQATGQLLVPLRRQANPNDPATIELEYGQIHKAGGWWRRQVDLSAPRCQVPTAYGDWRVTVPGRWTVHPAGGTMQAQPRPESRLGLADLVHQVARLWARAIDRCLDRPSVWGTCVLLMGSLAVLFAVFRRRWMPTALVLVLLGCILWVAIEAGVQPLARPEPLTSLNYAQAVSVDPSQSLHIRTLLVPAWRQAIRARDAAVAALVILGAVALAVWRPRWRWVACAAGLAAAVTVAAVVPLTWPVLKALGTWLVPACAIAWLLYRLVRRGPGPMAALAVTAACLVVCCAGCSGLGGRPGRASGSSQIEQVTCSLLAGDDSMEVGVHLRISAGQPASFPLLPDSAVLVSTDPLPAHVSLRTEAGLHVLHVDQPGRYDLEVRFVAALPPAGEDTQRRFELAMPLALANRVTLVIPDAHVGVEVPEAVTMTSSQQEGQTRVEALFTPGHAAVFTWRPRERQAAQEETRFYAQDVALAGVTPGVIQVVHSVRLQIAQGQVDRLDLEIGPGQTVTSVEGPQVGAWRFDPASRGLEVRLGQPVTGSYSLTVVTQSANASVPYDMRLGPLRIRQALEQHSVLGLAAEPSVTVQVDQHPAPMNVQDLIREAGDLVRVVAGLSVEQIGHAFRFESGASEVVGRVLAVQSELRSRETARFNVEDDRLVYNSLWEIEIAKAGRFDVDLLIPEGFDIDALEASEVSHWDDGTEADQRRVRVHFKRRLTGPVRLNLTLSRAISEIPDRLTVPRVTVAGGLKHSGHLVIGSEQGVRLTVTGRQGVSEVNPVELGHNDQGLLAFQFLRPDWQLDLQTELIQARIQVQGLHVARVTDGLVRHQHFLRYQLLHAGTKAFGLVLPPAATGVTLAGPGIARREQTGPGQWRVELADKVYDRPYLMTVTYETRYDPADGNVPLVPVLCQDADLQQGSIAVFATDRVELSAQATDAALRPADARGIPETFGAGDLSGAVLCYRSISPQYTLAVRARRHSAAEQVGAEVLRTDVVSVLTASGQALHRVVLALRGGRQRHLQAVLPEGATIWSLAVDGQAVQPSLRTTVEGRSAFLIPLPQQASDDILADLVYVAPLAVAGRGPARASDWSGRHTLSGPRFDLPLKNITWQVYMPQGFRYGDFGGTLSLDPSGTETERLSRYDLQTYQAQILEVNRRNEQVAQQQQSRARELAQKGEQTAARQALTKGYNFSIGNTGLNEDIRVDLDNLLRQQAKVGLINARGRLRQQAGALSEGQTDALIQADAGGFSPQQAEQMESSLSRADSENLELITRRVIQTQAAAEAQVSQLQVTLPVCGQRLQFGSPLQVEPDSDMAVTFSARPKRLARVNPSLGYGVSLFVVLLVGHGALSAMGRAWGSLHRGLVRTCRPSAQARPQGPGQPAGPSGPDSEDGRVRTDDLL